MDQDEGGRTAAQKLKNKIPNAGVIYTKEPFKDIGDIAKSGANPVKHFEKFFADIP